MVPISPDEERKLQTIEEIKRVCSETNEMIEQSRELLKKSWLTIVTARRLICEGQETLQSRD